MNSLGKHCFIAMNAKVTHVSIIALSALGTAMPIGVVRQP